ncbi:MAG: radical SAM family heme chaperone HemW [Bacteroidales bacterium]|nr:radical SAM family heme chaperone HemW [Bacteroidales bacterium]
MIYLHIPFCHRKCTYCAFYSVVTSGDRQAYVDALRKELDMRRHEAGHPVRTVYFGGGTPSVLSVGQLGQIVDALAAHYDIAAVEEATLEANPEDLTPEYLHALAALGFFNRISIGVQSFSDSDLKLLNRRHSAIQAVEAVQNAFDAGFDNISVDLIYGLPHSDTEQWLENLRQVEQLPVSHLSAYALTIEPGTILAKQVESGRIVTVGEEEVLRQYGALCMWAGEHGFEQYEISNFCRPGFKARHNSRYWDRTPYLGVGAAAHSFDGGYRRWNVADVKQYVESVAAGHIAHEEEQLGLKDAHNEYLMTALRTVEGIAKDKVMKPFAARLAEAVGKFVDAGWVEETLTHYRPTAEGLLHADGMAAELFIPNRSLGFMAD